MALCAKCYVIERARASQSQRALKNCKQNFFSKEWNQIQKQFVKNLINFGGSWKRVWKLVYIERPYQDIFKVVVKWQILNYNPTTHLRKNKK